MQGSQEAAYPRGGYTRMAAPSHSANDCLGVVTFSMGPRPSLNMTLLPHSAENLSTVGPL